ENYIINANTIQLLGKGISDLEDNVVSIGLNKIQLDLISQQPELKKILDSRKGYSERIDDAFRRIDDGEADEIIIDLDGTSITINSGTVKTFKKIGSALFTGGLGKDVVDIFGGYDNVKESVQNLQFENNERIEGLYAIQTLNALGISGQEIQSWIDGEIDNWQYNLIINKMLIKNRPANFQPTGFITEASSKIVDQDGNFVTGTPIFGTVNEYYLIDTEEKLKAFGFLESTREAARSIYYSDEYGEDIKKLLGNEPILYIAGDYQSTDYLAIDLKLPQAKFKRDIEQFEFSGTGKVLNFIDEGFSPGVIGISALTGGFGGTLFGSATGLTGAGLGIAENIIIDAVAGTVLVASGVNPEEHPYLAMGTAFGVVGATSIPRIMKGLARNSGAIPEEYFQAISRHTDLNVEEVKSIIGKMDDNSLRSLIGYREFQEKLFESLRTNIKGSFDENELFIS
ncbi:hypothetical protein ACFL1H_06370, partial [Nanoarchaeota archaeon]